MSVQLKDIVAKKFDQLRCGNTSVLVSDYEARWALTDAVAYTAPDRSGFEVERSSRIGQSFIINIPVCSADEALKPDLLTDRLDKLFDACAGKGARTLAFSVSDLCGEVVVSENTARSVVDHIFKRIREKLDLETIVICSPVLVNTRTIRDTMLSLMAVMVREDDEQDVCYKWVYPRDKAPDEYDKGGKIEIAFAEEPVKAGTFNTLTIHYTVGRAFVKNAELAFAITHPSNWMIPQFAVREAPGYTTVTTSGEAEILVSSRPACGNKGFILQLKVMEGGLKKGERIEIVLGDRTFGSPGIKTQNRAMERQVLKVLGDFEDGVKVPWQHNDFTYGPGTQPSFEIKTGEPTLFDLICPTHVVKDKPFDGIVRLCDSVGNTCEDASFKGFLAVDDETLQPFNVRPEDQGHIVVRGLCLKQAGVQRIQILDGNKKPIGRSNPVICSEHSPEYSMYWGDLHMHSNLSDGLLDPDRIYDSAKHIAGLDFAALADHDTIMAEHEGHWQKTVELAAKWNKPGEFVTLLGFEFTERKFGGDRNVYYLNDTGPLINSGYDKLHPDELYDQLSKLKYKSMVIPHCVITNGVWEYSDPRFCRVAEVYSTHGSSENDMSERPMTPDQTNTDVYPPESSYSHSFSHGLKMGAIGGTDDHGGQPGRGFSWHNYRGGIMGVLMEDLTRESLWDAIWNRRVIATTGERIYLNMTVNDLVVGTEGYVEGEPEIEIEALGTDKIDMIELLRNEEIIHCFHGSSQDETRVYIDRNWDGKEAWYRCRLTQADGERAWTSPIWITKKES